MKDKFKKRKIKIRAKLKRVSARPRLSVFRSNKHIYAQIIDDGRGKTLVSACDRQLKTEESTRVKTAYSVGRLLAERAKKKKINQVYFDRGGYKYHGQVKALAQGARKGGLKF